MIRRRARELPGSKRVVGVRALALTGTRRRSARRALGAACGLVLALAACGGRATPAKTSTPSPTAAADCAMDGVERALSAAPRVAVIILLTERDASGEGLAARQQRLVAELGSDFEIGRRYETLAGVAGSITRDGFERARANPAVRCIQLDGTGGGG